MSSAEGDDALAARTRRNRSKGGRKAAEAKKRRRDRELAPKDEGAPSPAPGSQTHRIGNVSEILARLRKAGFGGER